MKLLLIVTGMPDVNGHGASAFNLEYVRALRKSGVQLKVIHLRSINPRRKLFSKRMIDDVECYSIAAFLNTRLLRKTIFIEWLFSIFLKKVDYAFDVVHSVSGGAAIAAKIAARAHGTPMLLQFIGSDVNRELPQLLRSNSFCTAVKSADFLCFNSDALRHTFGKKYDLSGHAIRVLRRGAPLDELIYKFDFQDEVRVLFLGGAPSGNSKGAYTLIEAILQIDRESLSRRVCFAIGGPRSETLRGLLATTNKNITCEFLGAISRKRAIEEFVKSHVVVIPSLNEGIPNVLYEAMATGNMVIASDVGGVAEVLRDEVTGALISPGNPGELAEKILHSIENVERIQKCAHEGRRQVEHYSYSNFMKSYLDIYRKVYEARNS